MITFTKRLILGLCLFAAPLFSNAQFRVVGYLTNWGDLAADAANVDYTKVTHINIAFVNPEDAAGNLTVTNGMQTAINTIHANNVKVLISMGGASAFNSKPNWPTLIQDANRAAFITKIVQYVNTYGLDGVDVDIEGSDVNSNYAKFVADLSAALKPNGKLLTSALATWFASRITNATLAYFDWVNIMSYDAYGTWTGPGQHSPYSMAESDLNYWHTTKGLPKEKMVVGVPFYGYSWDPIYGNAAYPYSSIIDGYPRATTQDSIHTITNGLIYHNSIPTIKQKTSLAINQASGIMIWTLQYDVLASNPNSLLKAINDVVNATLNNIPPTVSITSPASNSSYTETDTITFTIDAADSDGSISFVSLQAGSTRIGETTTSPYTIKWYQPAAGTYKIVAKASDNVPSTTTSDTVTITISPATTQTPFGKTATIPGKVEAENFDIGNNLGYFDSDQANNGGSYRSTSVDIEACSDAGGGYNIGWSEQDEWLAYTIYADADTLYDLYARVATTSSGRKLHIEIDGYNVTGSMSVPNNNGWQVWDNSSVRGIRLSKGKHLMKVVFETGDINFNYVLFKYNDPLGTGIFNSASNSNKVIFYPNPFNENATIKVDLPSAGQTKVSLFDITGKEIYVAEDAYLGEGSHYINLSGNSIPKGFYICRIIQEDKVMTTGVTKE